MTPLSSGTDRLASGSRVLILGGTGFIGRHLARRCRADGALVTVAGRSTRHGTGSEVTDRVGDVRDAAALAPLFSGKPFHHVFNLSGYIDHRPYFEGGREVVDQHLTGLLNILDRIDRSALRRFVQIGSSDEYGDAPGPQGEEARGHVTAPYGFAKRAATDLLTTLSRAEGFPASVARLFLVYGPGQDEHRLVPHTIRACLAGERFAVSEGRQVRDFCHVEDVVDGLVRLALSESAEGEVVNIASGRAVSVREMVEVVVDVVGCGAPEFGLRPYRTGENMLLVADTSKATRLLRWTPSVDLKTGLRRTVDAFRERGD